MALDSMNVSLPREMKGWVEQQARSGREMKGWVEQQARSGRYSNVSDYVRDLIRHDQERAAKIEHMQKLVDEGRASGISTRSMEAIRQEARAKAGYGKLSD